MPTLNKSNRRFSNYKKHDISADISKIYNTSQWRKLRLAHLMQHPLCENCQANNIITPAICVHHKQFISTGTTELEMKDIAYDPSNLMSLCENCHNEFHTQAKRHNIKYIDYLKIRDTHN